MDWFLANSGQVFTLAGQHLALAVLPMVFGLLISIPLAQVARQSKALRSVVVTASSLLYTIPSLALFIILPTIIGTRILDPLNVVVALTIYAVALLVRAALDAFDSVDEDLRQAAVAMGFKPVARFLQIDLPLSLPVMFAGLRVVSVSNISLVSVAALLGIGNLGMLFTSGLQRDFVTEVVVGIIAILILALLMDAVLVLLERLLTPWTRAGAAPGAVAARPHAGSGASPEKTGPAAAAMRLSDAQAGGGGA
ncbi:ABC transporter permease [Pseudarthrobacter albicanus]|uniref:ABC transporter permease n=1 Tax=Pseudarthrobacter albicanus TaxID=2823873 RepID=UPI001BABB97C|nr:ABC transporter permease [Pseudarthrobacter albicanus]